MKTKKPKTIKGWAIVNKEGKIYSHSLNADPYIYRYKSMAEQKRIDKVIPCEIKLLK